MKQLMILALVLITSFLKAQDISLVVQSGHSSPITDVKISADNKYILSAGEDKRIIVWDRKTQKQFGVLEGHTDIVTGLAVNSFEPEYIYSVSYDNTFRKWNIVTGECVQKLDLKTPLGAIDFSPEIKKFVIGGVSLYLVDNQLKDIEIIQQFDSRQMYSAGLIEYVAFDSKGEQIAFSDGKGKVGSIDLRENGNGVLISPFPVSAVEYSDNGKYVYLAHYKGGFSRHHINSYGVRRSPVMLHFKRINDFEILDKYYALGNEKGRIILLSKRSLLQRKRIKAHKSEIISLDISSDKAILVSATINGEIKLWDTKSYKLIESYQGKVNRINDIDFSLDGKTIFVGFNNGLVRAFNLPDFLSASVDSRELVNGLNERKNLTLRNLQIQDDTLNIALLKTKQSAEYLWMYDYIKDIDIQWNYLSNSIQVNKVDSQSKVIIDYYKNIKEAISIGSKPLLDDGNLICSDPQSGLLAEIKSEMLFLSKNGNYLKAFNTGHSDKITCVSINSKGNFIATGSWDGLVKLWDIETGKLIMSLVLIGADQFVMVNPDGYYFSSRKAFENVNFRYKNEIFSFDQFDLKFNRPDIVLAGISELLDSTKIQNYHLAYKKRLSKLGVKEDELELSENVPALNIAYNQNENSHYLMLKIDASTKSGQLHRLHVNVNGVPEFTTAGRLLEGQEFKDSVKINLNPGKNVIQTYVTSANGTGSLKKEFKVTDNNHKLKRTLYIVTLGASEYMQRDFNLNYAAKDAVDITNFFSQNKIWDSVVTIQLLNNQVTKTNVEAIKEKLQKAGENDIVIFFAAGHGLLSNDLDFYFASYDMDFSHPEIKGIPYTLFDEILDNCKSRYKCLLMDACHSGEIDKEEVAFSDKTVVSEGTVQFRNVGKGIEKKESGSFDLSKALFADMRPNNGTTVISSAGGAEFAMEGEHWKNGVFTYAFLNGLVTGDADFNHDKSIQLSEIHRYVAEKVVELTKGKQTPTSRVENVYNDFKIK